MDQFDRGGDTFEECDSVSDDQEPLQPPPLLSMPPLPALPGLQGAHPAKQAVGAQQISAASQGLFDWRADVEACRQQLDALQTLFGDI
jgi:hypothetical protein